MPTLFGSPTSPFVRRVRVAAHELAIPLAVRDSREAAVQAELRTLSPIWKVPILVRDDGTVLFDSRAIVSELAAPTGWAPMRPPVADESNLQNAIDGATDAIVNRYLIAQDGVDVDGSAYLRKQRERAAAALEWVAGRIRGAGYLTGVDGFGPAELALATTLDWLAFRGLAPIADHRLDAFAAFHADRPSLRATRPGPTF